MRVGFIGLGNMGVAMAATLIKAGHELTVYNRTPAKAEALVDQGARYAQTVADACRGEVVITMLSDDNALENVVFGENGIATVLSAGAIHISSSTVSVALADKLTAAHAAKVRSSSLLRFSDVPKPQPPPSCSSPSPVPMTQWTPACRSSMLLVSAPFASARNLPPPRW